MQEINNADNEAATLRYEEKLPVDWAISEVPDGRVLTDQEADLSSMYYFNRRTMKEFLYFIFILNEDDAKDFCEMMELKDTLDWPLDVRAWNIDSDGVISENPSFLRFTINEPRQKLVHWFFKSLQLDHTEYICNLNFIKGYASALYPDAVGVKEYRPISHGYKDEVELRYNRDPDIARVLYNGEQYTLDQGSSELIYQCILNCLNRCFNKNFKPNYMEVT